MYRVCGAHLRAIAPGQHCSSRRKVGGELLATLCSIWPARDLNLRPPAPETNAFPLDQLAGLKYSLLLQFPVFSVVGIALPGFFNHESIVQQNVTQKPMHWRSWRKSGHFFVTVLGIVVVVAAYLIYPPVTGQHQMLIFGRSTHFSLR